MADLTTIKEARNNIFTVRLELIFRKAELDLMESFGEPRVEIGGDFIGNTLDSPSITISYTLAKVLRRIKSQFPLTQSFDGNVDSQAEDKARIWSDTIKLRLEELMIALRAKVDDFTSEDTEVI